MKLTKEQSKMVIEYFSAKAAEEAPATDTTWENWDKHMWVTCFDISLKLERMVNIKDWAALLNAQLTLQTFDRSPESYLFDRGDADNARNRQLAWDELRDVVSMWIDTVHNTTKAA